MDPRTQYFLYSKEFVDMSWYRWQEHEQGLNGFKPHMLPELKGVRRHDLPSLMKRQIPINYHLQMKSQLCPLWSHLIYKPHLMVILYIFMSHNYVFSFLILLIFSFYSIISDLVLWDFFLHVCAQVWSFLFLFWLFLFNCFFVFLKRERKNWLSWLSGEVEGSEMMEPMGGNVERKKHYQNSLYIFSIVMKLQDRREIICPILFCL